MVDLAPDAAPRERSVWRPVAVLVALMWLLTLVDALLPGDATALGIRSREAAGVPGIVAAPVLHSGWGHLVANTVPFVVLGLLVSWRAGSRFWPVLAVIVLVGGGGVWLLGPADVVTVGASGLVLGMLTYLVAAGLISRRPLDVGVGALVLLLYGAVLWQTLPWFVPEGVSWLGHLCGAIGGVVAALAFTSRPGRSDA